MAMADKLKDRLKEIEKQLEWMPDCPEKTILTYEATGILNQLIHKAYSKRHEAYSFR